MLCELNVENLLLIEHARLRLAPGLNVITGETGAGKTVLAHALDLLLGGRARPGIVRPGAGEAYVEGVFELPICMRADLDERWSCAEPCQNAEIPGGGADVDDGRDSAHEEIVLARRVDADAKRTRAYVNGRSATVSELREVGSRLLSFYGQHEHRKLTVASAQLQILDEICGPGQNARLRACAQAHRESLSLQAELDRLGELAEAREREIDLLAHELSEIEEAIIDQAEYGRLLGARERVRRVDALCAAAGAAAEELAPESGEDPGAAALLASAAARLQALIGVDGALDGLSERLHAIAVEAQELAGELRDYGEQLAGEDGSLEELEGRLAGVERLMRKYGDGGSIPAVLAYAEQARARHAELDGAEVERSRVHERLERAHAEHERAAMALRRARRQAAPRLAQAVREQLAALAMPEAEFDVMLGEHPLRADGGDTVEMMLAPNRGVPAGSLREIASGGELSRVMLAVITASLGEDGEGTETTAHTASTGRRDRRGRRGGPGSGEPASVASVVSERGERDERATLVFDEIDAGIGGHTARAVGERLRALGQSRQVLCITHLPQIASLGARHFSIAKDTSADPARTTVVQLQEPEVVSELVRMLGAREDDRAARQHASDLRKAA